MSNLALELSEQGLLPDGIVRKGIRSLLQTRLKEICSTDTEQSYFMQTLLVQQMNSSPIALQAMKANQQHYELPVAFYTKVLGQHLKYSCAYWDDETRTLDQAEQNALRMVVDRAGLQDGMQILDLGCGWGSLTLFMAEQYPNSRITAVSNSRIQAGYIRRKCELLNLQNVEIIRADMNDFTSDVKFHRVVSIEMFEHMRNWSELFQRIDYWLLEDGEFFMHIFTHRSSPYLFEDKQTNDWMSRHFFTGGMMPSADLPLFFQRDLALLERWCLNGQHYQKTSNTWLENMDNNRDVLMPVMQECYGKDYSHVWWMRWRMFFMACAELFGYRSGEEWFVSHYRFGKQ